MLILFKDDFYSGLIKKKEIDKYPQSIDFAKCTLRALVGKREQPFFNLKRVRLKVEKLEHQTQPLTYRLVFARLEIEK